MLFDEKNSKFSLKSFCSEIKTNIVIWRIFYSFPDYSDITTLNTVMGGWMSRGEEDSL